MIFSERFCGIIYLVCCPTRIMFDLWKRLCSSRDNRDCFNIVRPDLKYYLYVEQATLPQLAGCLETELRIKNEYDSNGNGNPYFQIDWMGKKVNYIYRGAGIVLLSWRRASSILGELRKRFQLYSNRRKIVFWYKKSINFHQYMTVFGSHDTFRLIYDNI